MKGFIDTNIFVYALERHPRFGVKSKDILDKVDAAEFQGYTSTLTLQEICWYLEADRKHREMEEVMERVLNSQIGILQVSPSDILTATRQKQTYSDIELNDLINYTVMKRRGITSVFTNDRHFDELPDVERTF